MTIPRAISDKPDLQAFIDEVTRVLAEPKGSRITWSFTKSFVWKADLATSVDVALGVTARPSGLIVLAAEREGADLILSGCRLDWSWRSGYARISAVDGTATDATISATNHRVTLGVVL